MIFVITNTNGYETCVNIYFVIIGFIAHNKATINDNITNSILIVINIFKKTN